MGLRGQSIAGMNRQGAREMLDGFRHSRRIIAGSIDQCLTSIQVTDEQEFGDSLAPKGVIQLARLFELPNGFFPLPEIVQPTAVSIKRGQALALGNEVRLRLSI